MIRCNSFSVLAPLRSGGFRFDMRVALPFRRRGGFRVVMRVTLHILSYEIAPLMHGVAFFIYLAIF